MLQKVHSQLYFLVFLAGIFLASCLSVIFFTDPVKAGTLTIFIFYFCLFFFSLTLFTLIIYGLRARFAGGLHQQRINVALRQAFWIALFITGTMFLSSHSLLHWWITVTFIITLSLIEGFFLT